MNVIQLHQRYFQLNKLIGLQKRGNQNEHFVMLKSCAFDQTTRISVHFNWFTDSSITLQTTLVWCKTSTSIGHWLYVQDPINVYVWHRKKKLKIAFKRNWINLFHINKIRYGEKFLHIPSMLWSSNVKICVEKLLVSLFLEIKITISTFR